MSEKRIQFSNIVRNQLPSYVKEEFPLVSEFLSQYYLSQEFQGAPIDLIQNIDKYIKVDEVTHQVESAILSENISSIDAYSDCADFKTNGVCESPINICFGLSICGLV
jgi:hypothetical protein